ncbi:type VI secretion system baseplate subunit TssF, partial [candidate division CSSED10-310 bacterium]
MTFNKYYQQELQNLRELAKEFAREHPAIAPMLSGQTSDPDVERLLEGVAFLTGLLHQKLEDEFPEIIHGLTDIIFPHFLKPIPSASIVSFYPKPSLKETLTVPAGISLASNPVEGSQCTFKTCFDLEVHPLKLVNAVTTQQMRQANRVIMTLELTAGNLENWVPNKLAFFLGGPYAQAAELFMLLTRYVTTITINPLAGGVPCSLSPSQLRPIGFDQKNSILSFP